jgi:hypothetical protein
MRRFCSVSTITGNDEKCACVLCCSSHENSHRAPVCRACTNATSGFELRARITGKQQEQRAFRYSSRYLRHPVISLLFAKNSRKIRENGNVHTSSSKVSDFDRIRRKITENEGKTVFLRYLLKGDQHDLKIGQ